MQGIPWIIVGIHTSLKVGHLPSSNKSTVAKEALNESRDEHMLYMYTLSKDNLKI